MAVFTALDALEIGDVVCLFSASVGGGFLKRATPEVLAQCRVAFGLSRQTVDEGSSVAVRLPSGVAVPGSETGLEGPGWAIVGPDGRPLLVDEVEPGDFLLGPVDELGALTLDPRTAYAEPGARLTPTALLDEDVTIAVGQWLRMAPTAPRTVQLPPAIGRAGRGVLITRENDTEHEITVLPDGDEQISGADSYVDDQPRSAVALLCSGTDWTVVGSVFQL